LVAPKPGERLLDLACGTGGVALIAARAGADVTGADISPGQLEKARAAAAAAGLSIRFDEADAEALPYDDERFDAAVSAFGMIFAPDHVQAAAELTRVVRRGGRIAITSWPVDDWHRLNARLRPDYENLQTRQWADEQYVRKLFPELELSFDRGEATVRASSAEDCWQLLAASVPGLKAWLDLQDDEAREAAHQEFLPLLSGGALTREYVLTLGTRR
jgi:ubiquinone/menaquinone biosynthesis C-methylase UbiE